MTAIPGTTPSAGPERAVGATTAVDRALRTDLGLCLALAVQFLLGMVANLFVTIPDQHPGANAQEYFGGVVAAIGWALTHGPGWVAAHVFLGTVLVVGGIAGVITTRRAGSRAHTVLSSIGALAIIGAGFNGASFVNYGHDASSMVMAGLWAIALSCYVVGLFLLARRAATTATAGPASTEPSPH